MKKKIIIGIFFLVLCNFVAASTFEEEYGVANYMFNSNSGDRWNGHDGTNVGTCTYSNTVYATYGDGNTSGNASIYSDNNCHVNLPSTTYDTFQTGNGYVFSMWFKEDTETTHCYLMQADLDDAYINIFKNADGNTYAAQYDGAGWDLSFTNVDLDGSNAWHHYAWTWQDSDNVGMLFIDGVNVENDTGELNTLDPGYRFQLLTKDDSVDSNARCEVYVTDVRIYNHSNNNATAMYNLYYYGNMSGQAHSPPPPPEDTLNITATYPPTNAQFSQNTIGINATISSKYPNLSNCSLYINGSLNQTETGLNDKVNFTLTLADGDYLYSLYCLDNQTNETTVNKTFFIDNTNPNLYSNLSGSYWSYNIRATFNATDNNLYSAKLNDSCGNNYLNNTDISSPYYFVGNYDISSCGLGTQHSNVTICDGPNGTALNCISAMYTWTSNARLNVSAKDIYGTLINNFSVYVNGTLDGSTTTGTYSVDNLSLGDYNVSIIASEFALGHSVFTINDTFLNDSIILFSENSIYMHIYNELGVTITQLVNIKLTSNATEINVNTSNGTYYISELDPNEYQILFASSGYTSRTYTVTVGNLTDQYLNAYLSNSSYTYPTTFTITDYDTSTALENVLCTQYKYINGSWVALESKYSDITGKAIFYYENSTNYRFYLTKEDYDNYIFYLNPVLYSSYDIKMSKSVLVNYTVDLDKLSVIYSPTLFTNNEAAVFNWLIHSPDGILINYGITVTYPGGFFTDTGNNAIGGQLSGVVNITNATIWDSVRLDYYYTTSLSGRRNFTFTLPIIWNGSTNATAFTHNLETTYGLGVFERVLVATLVFIFVVGIATLVGQPLPGLALGMLVLFYMTYLGFIELWLFLPSMLIGVLFITWKSGGY